MDKKLICFSIIISLCIISLATIRADLIITPQNQQISVTINQPNNFSISLNSTFNMTIYDVSFSNLTQYGFIFPSNLSISPNSVQNVNFVVSTNASIHQIVSSPVTFNYLVNLPEQISNYYVGISSNGFNSTFTNVRNGDTITWTNLDSISHTIFSSAFGTISIPSNSSRSFTFNQIGTFSYYDTNFNVYNQFNGIIQVVDRTLPQKVHNPNYDSSISLNLQSSLNPTNLSTSNSNSNYSINKNSNVKGLITINNLGGTNAEGISISSDSTWVTFDHNNFNINAGQTDWVTYTITPLIFNTNQTNQTYTINFQVSSFNAPTQNFSVQAFIPFYEASSGLTSDTGFLIYLQNVYCPLNPCSYLCSPNLPQCNANGSSNGLNGNLTLNVTSQDWNNYLRQQSQQGDTLTRLQNQVSGLNESLSEQQNQSASDSKDSLNISKSNQELLNQIVNLAFGTMLFITTIVSVYFLGKKIKKARQRKELIDVPFNKNE